MYRNTFQLLFLGFILGFLSTHVVHAVTLPQVFGIEEIRSNEEFNRIKSKQSLVCFFVPFQQAKIPALYEHFVQVKRVLDPLLFNGVHMLDVSLFKNVYEEYQMYQWPTYVYFPGDGSYEILQKDEFRSRSILKLMEKHLDGFDSSLHLLREPIDFLPKGGLEKNSIVGYRIVGSVVFVVFMLGVGIELFGIMSDILSNFTDWRWKRMLW